MSRGLNEKTITRDPKAKKTQIGKIANGEFELLLSMYEYESVSNLCGVTGDSQE